MGRNLIICTDGTWNTPDQRDQNRLVPSNVVKMSRASSGQSKDGTAQLVYYDAGVGTGGIWDRLKGGMFGVGLSENVTQAYAALGQTYQPGDRLFLFGFSRGAYTARSLAGLIGLCGIPAATGDRGKAEEIAQKAMAIYRMDPQKDSKARDEKAAEHARKFAHRTTEGDLRNEVWFIGVWDTVGALGVPLGKLNFIASSKHKFHDVTLGAHIRHACHALAIDERRRPFSPALWMASDTPQSETQKVQQLWFPGVHSNIGGGYLDAGLSDRAFLWIALQARDCGMGFDATYMGLRVDPNYHAELRDSMTRVYRTMGPVSRQMFGARRRADGGTATALGEAIHYSAKRRFEHVTQSSYAQSHARENLGKALADTNNMIAPPLPDEGKIHMAGAIDWNGDPAAPTPQTFN